MGSTSTAIILCALFAGASALGLRVGVKRAAATPKSATTQPLVSEGFEYINSIQGTSSTLTLTTGPGSLNKSRGDDGWNCVAFDTRTSVMKTGDGVRGISFRCPCSNDYVMVGLQQADPSGSGAPQASRPATWNTQSRSNFKQVHDAGVKDNPSLVNCVGDNCAGHIHYAFDAGFYCTGAAAGVYAHYGASRFATHFGTQNPTDVYSLIVDANTFKWLINGVVVKTETGVTGERGGVITDPLWPVATIYGGHGAVCSEPALNQFQFTDSSGVAIAPAALLDGHGHGDPHLMNIKGEHFDVMQEGNMLLVETPRRATSDTLNLAVNAEIERLGALECGPTYITQVAMHGAWLEHRIRVRSGKYLHDPALADKHAFGILVDDAQWLTHASILHGKGALELSTDAVLHTAERTFLLKVKGLDIVVSQPKRPRIFLDVQIKGLETLPGEVGGLLGIDDHSEAERLPAECQ